MSVCVNSFRALPVVFNLEAQVTGHSKVFTKWNLQTAYDQDWGICEVLGNQEGICEKSPQSTSAWRVALIFTWKVLRPGNKCCSQPEQSSKWGLATGNSWVKMRKTHIIHYHPISKYAIKWDDLPWSNIVSNLWLLKTYTYTYISKPDLGPVSVALGPISGKDEIKEKKHIEFWVSENSKTQDQVSFTHFHEICKTYKIA